KLAARITQAINSATETSTKRAHPCIRGHRWWNQECASAVRTLHGTIRNPYSKSEDIQEVRKVFKHAVRHSERNFWKAKIDGFKDPQDVFNAAKWNQTAGALPISP